MNEPTISIIIPVYNVERYIDQCLNSILSQKYKDFEAILINDGSTDRSGDICEQFAQADNRFKVIHKKNEGVSIARNIGIQQARGKWISFIDSDDWLEDDFLLYLLNMQKENVDLIACSFNKNNQKDSSKLPHKYPEEKIAANEMQWKLFYNKENLYYGYLWNKIFKREIILKNNIKFHEDLFYNEDRVFIFEYSLFCKNVIQINKCLYNYRIHNNSSMSKLLMEINNKTISELKSYCYLLNNDSIASQLKILISKNAEYILCRFYIKAKNKEYEQLHQYGNLYLKYNFNYMIWTFIHSYAFGCFLYNTISALKKIKHIIHGTL